MFVSQKKIYISKSKNILFDLKDGGIYRISNEFINNMDKNGDIQTELLNDTDKPLYQKISNLEIKYSDQIECLKIHVSNSCNLRCSYCYANKGNYGNESELMSVNTAENVINFINEHVKNYPLKYITFFGGEPLLAVDIIEMVCEAFLDKGILFLMQTNGTVLNEKILNVINKYNIMITVSLDGPREINDFNRVDILGNGTYDKIIDNMRLLSSNVKAIQSTISDEFIEQYSKDTIYSYLFKKTGISFLKVEYELNSINRLKEDDIEKEVEEFFKYIIDEKFIVDGNGYRILKFFFSTKNSKYLCPAGTNFLTIDVNGNVFPCQLFINNNEYFMGNVEDKFFYKDTSYKAVVEKLVTLSKDFKGDCNNCLARFFCSTCIAGNEKESINCINKVKYARLFLEKFADIITEGNMGLISDTYIKVNS